MNCLVFLRWDLLHIKNRIVQEIKEGGTYCQWDDNSVTNVENNNMKKTLYVMDAQPHIQ